jgi:hypothetical protein
VTRSLAAAAAALILTAAPVLAAPPPQSNGSAKVNYKVLPTVKMQVMPNYLAGFGPQGGLGSGSTPAAGPSAVLHGGTVDFGNVVVGYQYLYKYAAQVSVQSNDSAGFVVYGEGATDLNGSNPVPAPATFPLAQTLYWLVSASGNSPFSPATTFNKTIGIPLAGGANGIDYSGTGGVPSAGAMVWSTQTAGNLVQGYDYQLRLSSVIPISQFNVYIVYTVIGN